MPHDHLMQETTWWDLWNPWLLLIVVAVAVFYLRATGSGRERYPGSAPVAGWKKFSFLSGLALLFGVQGTPIHYYGHHYLFSVHMFEQAVVYLVVPPLLMAGMPDWLIRRLLDNGFGRKVVPFITRPLLSMFVFNVLFSFYHMPVVFDAVANSHVLHIGYHLVLFFTAIQMWWPVIAPLPELDRLTHLRKIGYIIASGVLLTPACALIIFATTPLYQWYAHAPQLFAVLPRMDDQQLGGVVMKLMQEVTYGTALIFLFYSWYKKENAPDNQDLQTLDLLMPIQPGKQPDGA